MKRISVLLLAALFALPHIALAKKDNEKEGLQVMSYNIRHSKAEDGTNSWHFRYAATAEMLTDQKPDVFGLQEALEDQVEFIEMNCRDYKWVGVGRDNGKKEGEFMAIFYNKNTVSLLKWGTFWLSETPSKPSMGWDAACFRTATWALMKDKDTGRKFYFVDTHLDHVGKEAQKNGLALIVSKISEINPEEYPMVLVGDFNVTPDDAVLDDLDTKMKSARIVADKTDNEGTYNNWGKASSVIDYIYFSGFGSCPEFRTVTDRYADRKFVSDHYPVTATLVF